MDKIIVEVGSTVTKIHGCTDKKVENLGSVVIEFKKNYKEKNELNQSDVNKLIDKINELKNISKNIYVCGTSIFRDLKNSNEILFFKDFKEKTGYTFNVISQDDENILTVLGATRNVNQKAAVFIGGGGSTEIAIYDNKITEMANSNFGVIDIMHMFPDLANDLATTDIETVKKVVKEKLNVPTQKADILILAGGAHKLFAIDSGISYELNDLYSDELQPIKMSLENRIKDSRDYYTKISMDEIKRKSDDPNWWYATRAMCAFVLIAAEAIGAKYIVPTDISMVYGIVGKE